jgi:hypothetical protein
MKVFFSAFFNMGEIPLSRNIGEVTFEGPRKSVEWATNLRAMPVIIFESATPVKACVRIRLNCSIILADHDVGLIGDVVDDVITGIWDLLFATRELPDSTPEPFFLNLVPFSGDVTLNGDIRITQIKGRFKAQHRWDWMGVGVK